MGGYLFPCSPEINWLVPPKAKICFLMFSVPQYCLCFPVPLKISPFSPVPLKKNALFRCSPKPLRGFHKLTRVQSCPRADILSLFVLI